MALKIYESANPATAFSSDGEFSNPISVAVDGIVGATILRRYFVRNDSALHYYTDIQVTSVVNSGLDIVSGATAGFAWKLIAGDSQPLEDQWGIIAPGNTMELADIGELGDADTTTYLPFWLRIEVPRGVDVQSFENVSLEITATEALA